VGRCSAARSNLLGATRSLGWLVFLLCIHSPNFHYWEEVHYIPAARELIAGLPNQNRQHPPLAKELIATGLMLFGDTPMGWRFMVSMFGALSLVCIFLWALALFGSERSAWFAVLFTLTNQFLYVESRAANLDTFMVTFLFAALAAFTISWRTNDARRQRQLVFLAGACLGLAIACKWVALVAWIICICLVVVVRQLQRWKVIFECPLPTDWYRPDLWDHVFIRHWVVGFLILPASIYYVTFVIAYGLLGPWQFLKMQFDAFDVLANSHQYEVLLSHWISWALGVHPIYFMFIIDVSGSGHGELATVVCLLGNPLILWLGIPSVISCVWGWIARRRRDALLIAIFYCGLYFCWAAIPRDATMYYYYFPSLMILGVAISYALTQTSLVRLSWLPYGTLACCVGIFVLLLPISSAAVGVTESYYNKLMLIRSWRISSPWTNVQSFSHILLRGNSSEQWLGR
jgi:dolichyl-phosphate-mannose-protein mannosyltransferase